MLQMTEMTYQERMSMPQNYPIALNNLAVAVAVLIFVMIFWKRIEKFMHWLFPTSNSSFEIRNGRTRKNPHKWRNAS